MKVKTGELEQLLDISPLLGSTLDLGEVLTRVLENAGALMEAEASNFMLLDAASGELVCEAALGEAGERIRELGRLKVGTGLAGWTAEHREPLLVEDAYKDPRFFPDFDRKTGFRTRSVLAVPLFARGELIGVGEILNKKGGGSFTTEDQALFTRFCHIAALAIDNALLHRRALEQERLQRDMRLAEEIQRASLPSDIPSIRNLNIECRSLACRYVAGDVVDITKLADGRLAVLVGDVSGKGVPAALFGSRFSVDFEYLARADPEGGSLMTRLNAITARRSTRGIFITAVYAVIDPATGGVELVNAGHLPPVIVGPDRGGWRRAPAAEHPPLGGTDGLEYRSSRLTLAPGESIVFMTDGVWDARAPGGERFGENRSREVMSECPGLAVPRLMKAVSGFTAGQPLADDITVVGVGYGEYEERTFPARTEALARVRRFVREQALAHGFDEGGAGAIVLAVDEAAANVIKHTYRMDPAGKMRIGVERCAGRFLVHLRDWGPRQDPARFAPRDLGDVRPGGLGLHYMCRIMDAVEFDDSLWDGNELHMLAAGKGGRPCG